MERLYENDLIYGRLLTIDQPHLIERYNKALKAFGVKPTKLKTFDIDKTGFSPQVADELKDYSYLDPNGVNRRYIILTPDQASLPLARMLASICSASVYGTRGSFRPCTISIGLVILCALLSGAIRCRNAFIFGSRSSPYSTRRRSRR